MSKKLSASEIYTGMTGLSVYSGGGLRTPNEMPDCIALTESYVFWLERIVEFVHREMNRKPKERRMELTKQQVQAVFDQWK